MNGNLTHWSDVLSTEMAAAEVLGWYEQTREDLGETLAQWLEAISKEIWDDEHIAHDWEALARQLEREGA